MSDRPARILDRVLDRIDQDLDRSLERLFDVLRIPSISMDAAYAEDCRRAAACLAGQLTEAGFAASVRPTAGQPIVVARRDGPPGAPRVLFYGHYDVQPAGAPELWDSPPFEPTLVEAADGRTRIVARGASDDKGQVHTFLEACRAWTEAAGDLPVAVTIVLEGEEEIDSPNLKTFLADNREELAADCVLVCDTGMWDEATPGITMMLRGVVGDEVQIAAADRDLHSGLFGGAARNPLHVLVEILASLRDKDGRITLPGFYDGVRELPAEIRAQWDRLDFDPTAFLNTVGLSVPAGETGRSLLEQIWSRPTCEIDGLIGGHTGPGLMTVVPSVATAKVSFRLVEGQDPQAVREAFRAYVEARVPADCRVTLIGEGGSEAVSLSLDGTWLRRARTALRDEWGREAALIGMGGSVPIVTDFRRELGTEVLMVGFARADDQIHSPNEKYDLASLRKGTRSWARILAGFAG